MGSQIVEVNEKGQITIPKDIRAVGKIHPRDLLRITYVPNMIFIDKVEKKSTVDEMLGFLRKSGLTMKDWEDIKSERDRSER